MSGGESNSRRWISLAVLIAAVLLLAIDGTVLSLAIPSLVSALGASAEQVLWIGDIYPLTLASFLIMMGSVADRIGRRRLLIIGIAGFAGASLLAAVAPTAQVLIGARLVMGFFGATIMPSTLALIRQIFTEPRQRTTAIAIWSAAVAGGAAIGPLVGGALLERFWWGSVFLINVPIALALIPAARFLLPEFRDRQRGALDLISALLSVVTTFAFVFTVKRLVTADISAVALIIGGISVAAGWLFVRRQRRLDEPLIDIAFFRNRVFRSAITANVCAIFGLSGLLYFFSQYLQLVRGYGPLQAGLAQLPAVIAAMSVVTFVTWLLGRLGLRRSLITGLSLMTTGFLAVALLGDPEHYALLALAIIPVGLGLGMTQTVATDAIVTAVPPRKAGTASAIAETGYELGLALGIAVLGSVLTAAYRTTLVPPPELSAEVAAALEDSLPIALAQVGADSALADLARDAFVTGMQMAAGAAAVITVIAISVIRWNLRGRKDGRLGQLNPPPPDPR